MEEEKLEVVRKIENLRREENLRRLSSQVPSERPKVDLATAVLEYQTPKRNTLEKQYSVGKILEVEANLETGDVIARHSITNVGSEFKFIRTMPGQSGEQRLVITTTETLPNTMNRSRRETETESEKNKGYWHPGG